MIRILILKLFKKNIELLKLPRDRIIALVTRIQTQIITLKGNTVSAHR
jgi:hypothetical protein